jgi:hypothetical protein
MWVKLRVVREIYFKKNTKAALIELERSRKKKD